VLSALLAKNLMSYPSYIARKPKSYFGQLINKKTKRYSIEFVFAVYDEQKNHSVEGLFAYSLSMGLNDGSTR
jgi:hypothetical protein